MIKSIAIGFWCVAVPVVENGDDYYHISKKMLSACDTAIEQCETHYHDCEIKYCGVGVVPSFVECDMGYLVRELEGEHNY